MGENRTISHEINLPSTFTDAIKTAHRAFYGLTWLLLINDKEIRLFGNGNGNGRVKNRAAQSISASFEGFKSHLSHQKRKTAESSRKNLGGLFSSVFRRFWILSAFLDDFAVIGFLAIMDKILTI